MTTEPVEELKALDDVPENADELVGDEVEADHDLELEVDNG